MVGLEHYTRSKVLTLAEWLDLSPEALEETEDQLSIQINEAVMSLGLPLASIAMVTRIVVGTDEHGELQPFAQASRIEVRVSKAVRT